MAEEEEEETKKNRKEKVTRIAVMEGELPVHEFQALYRLLISFHDDIMPNLR